MRNKVWQTKESQKIMDSIWYNQYKGKGKKELYNITKQNKENIRTNNREKIKSQ